MTMMSINTADAKETLSDLVSRVSHHKERIILTRRGKEIAALVSMEDLQFLEETRNKHDLDEAIDALKEARNKGTITLDALKEEIG